ncbi:hypothetical protein CPB85DRAFT_1440250 [Mucidula mucida]|nr:hypothetical protein CPB85DRAFT_1440250 [Mucidula mucida]
MTRTPTPGGAHPHSGMRIRKDNVPDFSCIHGDDPLELARSIIRACLTHARRGVLNFEGLVSSGNFHRMMEWPYIKGQEELDSFCQFIKELNIAKISRWWKQKEDNPWILSAIIQSQSLMDREDWYTTDATTNIGEAQHGGSADQTGRGLSLVAAIKEAQRFNYQVQEEVRSSVESGALRNSNNTAHHRMNNALCRSNAAHNKRCENQHRNDEITHLQTEAAEAASAKKAADAALKTARAEKSASITQCGKQWKPQYHAESSSSGRAKRSTHVSAPIAGPIDSDMSPSSATELYVLSNETPPSQFVEPLPETTPSSIAMSSISNPEQNFDASRAPARRLLELEFDKAWLDTLTHEDFQAMCNLLSQDLMMHNTGFGGLANGLTDLTFGNMMFPDFDGFGAPLTFASAGGSTLLTLFSSAESTLMLPGSSGSNFDLAPAAFKCARAMSTGPAADTSERSTQVRRVHKGGDVVQAMQVATTYPSTVPPNEGVWSTAIQQIQTVDIFKSVSAPNLRVVWSQDRHRDSLKYITIPWSQIWAAVRFPVCDDFSVQRLQDMVTSNLLTSLITNLVFPPGTVIPLPDLSLIETANAQPGCLMGFMAAVVL